MRATASRASCACSSWSARVLRPAGGHATAGARKAAAMCGGAPDRRPPTGCSVGSSRSRSCKRQNGRMDERPPVWVGHLVLNVSGLSRAVEFWREIGMRQVEKNDHVAVLELRGGTHLVLVPGTPHPGPAPFDLMVEDLEVTHAAWT